MINRINDVTMMFNVAMILSAPAEVRKQIQRPTPLAGCDLFSAPCMWGLQVGFLWVSYGVFTPHATSSLKFAKRLEDRGPAACRCGKSPRQKRKAQSGRRGRIACKVQ